MTFKAFFYSAALLAVASCGPGQEDFTLVRATWQTLKAQVVPTPPAERPVITRDMLAPIPGPVMLLEVPNLGGFASLEARQTRGDTIFWLSVDSVSISTKSGLVIASRGMGDDLMSADVSGVLRALRQGQGRYERRMQFLDGLEQTQTRTYACTMIPKARTQIDILGETHRVTQLEETCEGEGPAFTNTYWQNAQGLWQSTQWISPTVGHVTLQMVFGPDRNG